jgi:hypothetical protein
MVAGLSRISSNNATQFSLAHKANKDGRRPFNNILLVSATFTEMTAPERKQRLQDPGD